VADALALSETEGQPVAEASVFSLSGLVRLLLFQRLETISWCPVQAGLAGMAVSVASVVSAVTEVLPVSEAQPIQIAFVLHRGGMEPLVATEDMAAVAAVAAVA